MTIRKSITKEEEAKKLVEEVVRFILKSRRANSSERISKEQTPLLNLELPNASMKNKSYLNLKPTLHC
jgi:predicted thioredoxin/glutaredoxin